MENAQQYDISFQLDGQAHHGKMHIEHFDKHGKAMCRALIDTTALHGTFGGAAESLDLALDFLNLAMQAEGADDITFVDLPTES